jgi:hypothetical protein
METIERALSRRAVVALVVAALVVSACEAGRGDACFEPTAAEMEARSPVNMYVEPNPVEGGAAALLTVLDDGLPTGSGTGAGAEWQCWDGTAWVATHQLVRGFDSVEARAIEVGPGMTTSIPAVEFPLTNSFPIIVPDVSPGTYRIADLVLLPDGEEVVGFVHVLVD